MVLFFRKELLFFLLIFLTLAAAPDQRTAEQHAQAAEALASHVAASRVAAAAALQSTEQALIASSARLDALDETANQSAARLAALQARLQSLLPLLQRLTRDPTETLLAAPLPAEQAVTGLIVIEGLAQQIRSDAEALARERVAYAHSRQAAADALSRLQTVRARQAGEAAALDRSLAAAHAGAIIAETAAAAAIRQASDAASRAAALKAAVANASNLASRVRPSPSTPEVGRLVVPVAGTIVRRFGEATDAGPATGLSFQPPAGARVVSPCHGRLVFGAPFRSLGLLAIIDCGGGWHIVLSGLSRLDASPGAPVLAGEPIGVMPADRGRLYMELRRAGEPVDPGGRL